MMSSPVLVIGHTGFKGTWLTLLLEKLGVEVVGLSLPALHNSLYSKLKRESVIQEHFLDIRDNSSVSKIIKSCSPQYVFHFAAQPLVLDSYISPRLTFETNVVGTMNVLDALVKENSCKKIVVSTTDKVYKNEEFKIRFNEKSALGGKDPYSWSKVGTEAVIGAWQQISNIQNGPRITSVRAGNVIGGGDRSNNRLLPDLIKAFENNSEIAIRNPASTRPWQHVLDALWGYMLAITTEDLEPAYNFSPNEQSLAVGDVVNLAVDCWGNSLSIKYEKNEINLETKNLELDSSLAINNLKWKNIWSQKDAIRSTVKWWKNVLNKELSPKEACEVDLDKLIGD
jgi:CDP-glucose 4,6-dehydratase